MNQSSRFSSAILARLDLIAATLENLVEVTRVARAPVLGLVGLPAHYRVAEVAKLLKVKPEKVQLWIRRGELEAFNVASKPTGQPQWRVTSLALAAFQAKRAAKQTEPTNRPVKRTRRRYRLPIKEILR